LVAAVDIETSPVPSGAISPPAQGQQPADSSTATISGERPKPVFKHVFMAMVLELTGLPEMR